MAHIDVDDLKATYPDPVWRARFVQICDLLEMLGDCIIGDNYTISDGLNKAIVLSSAGGAVRDRLVSKHGVHPKEAKLMCALTVGHAELFIDPEKTDPDELASAVGAELEQQRIRFPFIFGRDLYDRYAELHDDEKQSLTNEETLNLLSPLPAGVYQYGRYTTGPYGLREAPTIRSLHSSRQVAAFHCSQSTCRTIHPVLLETSQVAAINRDREKLDALLRAKDEEAAEWWPFVAEVGGLAEAHFGDQKSGTLIPLVGDALSDAELRLLVANLLDSTAGEVRQAVGPFLKVGAAEDAVRDLDRAHLLQLALFATEAQIAASLDRLVRTRAIVVPRGEVRRAVTTRRMASGAFGLRGELGSLGVRFAAEDPGFPLLRERRMLDRLYVRSSDADVAELEWQLRGVEVEDLDERLDQFFHGTDPRHVLERIVLARKTNLLTACEEVGLDEYESLEDNVLIDTILWKLGFPVIQEMDPHARFWARHERLWALVQSSEIGASDRFLELANPYFSNLEGLLLESLAFTAWALLTDHIAADTPFSYDDEDDRRVGLQRMESIAPSPVGAAVYTAERVDLGNLISGFSALANHLEGSAKLPEKFARPENEFPVYDGKTSVKAFLLRSTLPFLDLTAPSQQRVLEGLREVTRLLAGAKVSEVRNEYSHYRRNGPDISKLEAALEAIRQAVTRLETLGFCRLLFVPFRVTRDGWGRGLHEFRGPRSYEHTFSRPSRFDWMGLPGLGEPAYLLRSASIGEPSELLRFTPRYRSAYSAMWEGFPVRRKRSRTSVPDQVQPHEPEVAASRQ